MTDWVEHPDLPDLYYRREGRTVQLAGREAIRRAETGSPVLMDSFHRDGHFTFVYDSDDPSLQNAHLAAVDRDPRGPDPDIHRRVCLFCGRDDCHHIREGNRPMIHVSATAAAPSKRMTLAELAAFVEQARTAGVPDTAGLNVSTKGFGHLRKITTEDGTGE